MQTTSSLLMIRPVNFGFNEQTALSNAFQQKSLSSGIQKNALQEFDNLVDILRETGLDIMVVDDNLDPPTPDSIFPNNWVSFHSSGKIFLYPMQAENRRAERNTQIIESLKNRFRVSEIVDISYLEKDNMFLEGTGSMVLDRENKMAYACLSPRTDAKALEQFCKLSGYNSCCFHAVDGAGKPIYHTNVMMCIGKDFSVICLDSLAIQSERDQVIDALTNTNKEIITITLEQMKQFAGNMLHVHNLSGESLLVMSERAYKSLDDVQISKLSKYARSVYAPLETIENIGGGSARCMIAEIHLPSI